MHGWTRSMQWPDTGLGCIAGGFSHGIGPLYPFRGLRHGRIKLDVLGQQPAHGAEVDFEAWRRTWREQARVYQEQSKRFWLYR